ncbi:MAG TPA: gluconate:H+ symporter [Cyclobacteriaceae bacterium]|nr:gluconate:H+ symporter [Cyclobacteriaceae bacterium]
MMLLTIVACIILLLVLILLKLNPLLALLIVSVVAGLSLGLAPDQVIKSIQGGVGDTLGSLALVLALGAMFGKIIEVSGAARQISDVMIRAFGSKRLPWAMMITGLTVGIPLFYNAGFVILVPLVFAVAQSSRVPLLWIAIPMAASLSVTHGFLPPHPGPTAIAALFKADIGKTLIYGFVLTVPIVVIAGPLFASLLKKLAVAPLVVNEANIEKSKPTAAMSFSLALFPVALMAATTALRMFFKIDHAILRMLSEPAMALLLALLLACYFLGWRRGMNTKALMGHLQDGVLSIALIMLVIAAGGGFKQVLVDSGVAREVADVAATIEVSPLVLGWLIAALVRVSVGSATVAGLTAAGIVSGLVQSSGVSPELMVLSVGAGSLMFSHVNDTGFWMFKEYFNLSLRQTFLSWTAMETIVSVLGLTGVLILERFVSV